MYIQGQDAENLTQFIRAHNQANDGLRLGQRFVNIFVKEPMPELYYEESDKESMRKISEWLTRHQYHDKMPPRINTMLR